MRKKKINIFDIHNTDARNIDSVVNKKIIDVTITSPPYYDMKDYGHKNQIGYGQTYEKYLQDLKIVFKKVFDITKETGTLWVIINTFRANNEIVPLPFDFSNTIKECGWKLQEIIIWSKDRTVPWTHIGQMRHMFEYVLVFSKNKRYNYYVDRIKDYVNLKKWWIKYPERYNPKGKTPAEIWEFDIPTQGSWGKGYIKHFCPLPEALVDRIIKLTTDENDVVLDPFSGSGTVLSQAAFTKRKYIGFELNKTYIKMFENYLKVNLKSKQKEYNLFKRTLIKQETFEMLILDLRALKFAKILRKKLSEEGLHGIKKIYVEKIKGNSLKKNKLIAAKYILLISKETDKDILKLRVHDLSSTPPLSKYGIEPIFQYSKNINNFLAQVENNKLFIYSALATHKYHSEFNLKDFKKSYPIISPIMVDLNEKDFI